MSKIKNDFAAVLVNSQAVFIKSNKLGQNIALVIYSEDNKCWCAQLLRDGPYSAETLMVIAKYVKKQNDYMNEFELAT